MADSSRAKRLWEHVHERIGPRPGAFSGDLRGRGNRQRAGGYDRQIVESNPALQWMLGYSGPELRALHFADITYPADVTADQQLYAELVAGQRGHYQLEKRYRRKDGALLWGRLTVSLVRREQGPPQFTIGMVEDVTAQKRMQRDLRRAHRRLAEQREQEQLRLARAGTDGMRRCGAAAGCARVDQPADRAGAAYSPSAMAGTSSVRRATSMAHTRVRIERSPTSAKTISVCSR